MVSDNTVWLYTATKAFALHPDLQQIRDQFIEKARCKKLMPLYYYVRSEWNPTDGLSRDDVLDFDKLDNVLEKVMKGKVKSMREGAGGAGAHVINHT